MSRAFDQIGAAYDEAFASKPGQVEAGAWLVTRLASHQNATVADIGCGSGVPTARQLAAAGITVVGVDSSPVMLELARINVPTGIFVERDLHDLHGLHPRQGRFDAAVAFFSLLMLPRADVGKVLDAIRDILEPDGYLLLGMVEGNTDFLMRDFLGAPVPLTSYPRDDLARLLAAHGFTVLSSSAEQWSPSTTEATEQTHLYYRCSLTPLL